MATHLSVTCLCSRNDNDARREQEHPLSYDVPRPNGVWEVENIPLPLPPGIEERKVVQSVANLSCLVDEAKGDCIIEKLAPVLEKRVERMVDEMVFGGRLPDSLVGYLTGKTDARQLLAAALTCERRGRSLSIFEDLRAAFVNRLSSIPWYEVVQNLIVEGSK